MNGLLTLWTHATGNLSWGVAKVFRDALTLVSEEKVTLVYGADYRNGKPCLVNSVAQMLSAGGGMSIIPSSKFGAVVRLFDQINGHLETKGVNGPDRNVSPLAADILLQYFAPEREMPLDNAVNEAMQTEAFAQAVYQERSDADLARDWLNSLQAEPQSDCDLPTTEHSFLLPRQATE